MILRLYTQNTNKGCLVNIDEDQVKYSKKDDELAIRVTEEQLHFMLQCLEQDKQDEKAWKSRSGCKDTK